MSAHPLYRRAHFYAGNVMRVATLPWKQHRISPAVATTLFGCSFGDGGWHHVRKTLEEYDADPAIDYRATTLYRYLTEFQPRSICDFIDPAGARCTLPLFVYPWGTFARGETTSHKRADTSRFCGPSSDAFVAEEFTRTIAQYESMKRTGYRPWRYPHTFIGGTRLIRRSGESRFVALQGNHRLAILAHLGVTSIAVRDWPGYLAVVDERDAASWPLVASGACSVEAALAAFQLFFDSTGAHVARALQPAR